MSIKEEVLALNPLEKIQLIDEILLSLDKPDEELDKIWLEESEKRMNAYKEGRTNATDVYKVLEKYNK